MEDKAHTCCFFGHRKIEVTEALIERLYQTVEKLIVEDAVDTFLFGSKSAFDRLCLKTVTELKKAYPHIRRIYVRAEFPHIDEEYRTYLLERYEDTYYPSRMLRAGRAAYVERNREMIDHSGLCVVYYDASYEPYRQKRQESAHTRSGTGAAYAYAQMRGIKMINLYIA